ncbi:MAG TPA: GNAT family N-acetyltransferase [Pyrinomonadaceae bacterium]|nr:GNAT family N-acetyltransferase [Pyrinomonadaceae bacterium]
MRAFTPEDLGDLCSIYGDPDVARGFMTRKPKSEGETLAVLTRDIERFDKRGVGVWGVVYKPDEKLIGRAAPQYLDQTPEVEVSFILARPYWGEGLATEAAEALLSYGFEEAGLARIVGVAHVDHVASHRVMEKAGVKYEREGRFYGSDMKYYSVSREEYEKNRPL